MFISLFYSLVKQGGVYRFGELCIGVIGRNKELIPTLNNSTDSDRFQQSLVRVRSLNLVEVISIKGLAVGSDRDTVKDGWISILTI